MTTPAQTPDIATQWKGLSDSERTEALSRMSDDQKQQLASSLGFQGQSSAAPVSSAPPPRPTFVSRLGESLGLPTSMDQLRQMGPNMQLFPSQDHPILAGAANAIVGPAGEAARAAINYGKNLYAKATEPMTPAEQADAQVHPLGQAANQGAKFIEEGVLAPVGGQAVSSIATDFGGKGQTPNLGAIGGDVLGSLVNLLTLRKAAGPSAEGQLNKLTYAAGPKAAAPLEQTAGMLHDTATATGAPTETIGHLRDLVNKTKDNINTEYGNAIGPYSRMPISTQPIADRILSLITPDMEYTATGRAEINAIKSAASEYMNVEQPASIRGYHGSPAMFDGPPKTDGLGAHFTLNKDLATSFSQGSGKVVEARLGIKNPLRVQDFGGSHTNAQGVIVDFVKQGVLPESFLSDIDSRIYRRSEQIVGPIGDEQGPALAQKRNAAFEKANTEELEKVKSYLKSKGYDGIVYDNTTEGGGDSYVAFDQKQIQSSSASAGRKLWTLGALDSKRSRLAADLASHNAKEGVARYTAERGNTNLAIDNAINDALRDTVYPQADQLAGKPAGYFEDLKQKQSNLIRLQSLLNKRIDDLQGAQRAQQGAPIGAKVRGGVYLSSEGGPHGFVGNLMTLLRSTTGEGGPLKDANSAVSSAFSTGGPVSKATVLSYPIRKLSLDQPTPWYAQDQK